MTVSRIAAQTASGRVGAGELTPLLRGILIALPLLLGWGARDGNAHTLGEIYDRKVFSICAAPDALPFSNKAGGPRGFQVDLAQLIAERLGVQLDVAWVTFRRSARSADCDAIMSSIVRGSVAQHSELPEKAARQTLTRPYAHMTTRVVQRAGAAVVTSNLDLRKNRVAVPPASHLHYLLR